MTAITPFGGATDLTTQYATARNEGAVRIVIMDVGGPDALLTCPEPPTQHSHELHHALTNQGLPARQPDLADTACD